MAISAEMARARARKANADMRGDIEAARIAARDLCAVKLEELIQKIVAEAPPLTEEQRLKLAGLLAGDAR